MSLRSFAVLVLVWAVAIWLATTPVGAMLGFLGGITVAFFIAPVVLLLNVPESWLWPAAWALAAAYALLVLVLALRGALSWARGEAAAARGWFAGAISLAATAAVLKLSADALVAAWP